LLFTPAQLSSRTDELSVPGRSLRENGEYPFERVFRT
jgi:hypothetical protein